MNRNIMDSTEEYHIGLNKDFNIKMFQPGDEVEIVNLLKDSFPSWNNRVNPVDYWKWKYLDTPLGTDIIVATDKKIIAVTHRMVLNLKFDNSIVLAQFGCDTATHLAYRGMGVYRKIVDKIVSKRIERKVKIDYGISRNPTVQKEWEKRGGIPFPHNVSYMVRIKDVRLHLKMRTMEHAAITAEGYSILANMNKLKGVYTPGIRPIDDFKIMDIHNFDSAIDPFLDEVRVHYNFMVAKSKDYLNWRFCDPRGDNFIVKQAFKDGKVLGYVALEIRNDGGYSEGFVADMLALPNRRDVAYALLREACDFFDVNNVNVVYYMVLSGHSYRAVSNLLGFIDSRRGPYIIIQFFDMEKGLENLRLSNPDQVHFSYCDAL